MKFFIQSWRKKAPASKPLTARLTTNGWNDYNFITLHFLTVFDAEGEEHDIGQIKIGQLGQRPDTVRTDTPPEFDNLPERFFSLGQSDTFYSNLRQLGNELNDLILGALQDIAYSQESYERAIEEEVTQRSLLRDITVLTVQGQFRRLARGGERLSRYQFAYQLPTIGRRRRDSPPPVVLAFDVLPESNPPTNVHVVIGRNGVGKTHLLQGMTQALVSNSSSANGSGIFLTQRKAAAREGLFANVVSVTFSAFDPFDPLPDNQVEVPGLKYAYVGLKQQPGSESNSGRLKSQLDLQDEFASSLRACRRKARLDRLRRAVAALETDPVFRDNGIRELLAQTGSDAELSLASPAAERRVSTEAAKWFSRLSSGHKIVLLTIVRLVETVEERTLVLLDEPEAHLHPPLLARQVAQECVLQRFLLALLSLVTRFYGQN